MRPTAADDMVAFARDLRNEMTSHEAAVWHEIRKRQLGVRFRRQVPIGLYVADFACLNPKLVIEIDGSVHDGVDESKRTSFIESYGFAVIRFTNDEVEEGTVAESIRQWLAEH